MSEPRHLPYRASDILSAISRRLLNFLDPFIQARREESDAYAHTCIYVANPLAWRACAQFTPDGPEVRIDGGPILIDIA